MNTKKILNNLQERIALDNFEIQGKHQKQAKRLLVIGSALALIVAGIVIINLEHEAAENEN